MMRSIAFLAFATLASAAVPASPMEQAKLEVVADLVPQAQELHNLQASTPVKDYLAVVQGTADSVRAKLGSSRVGAFISVIIYAGFIALVAFVYKTNRKWPAVDKPGHGEEKDLANWSTGPFDCTHDLTGFVFACCCSGIRVAESVSMVGVLGFWVTLAILEAVLLASSFLPFLGLGLVIAGILWRQTFRKRFNMPGQGECFTYLTDGLLYTCCVPCAVAQEARHLEEAAKHDHPAVKDQRPVNTPVEVPV